MEKQDKRRLQMMERSTGLLFSLMEYLNKNGIVSANDFISFCTMQPKGAYRKEIDRDEEDAKSVTNNLHPGGIRSDIINTGLAVFSVQKLHILLW